MQHYKEKFTDSVFNETLYGKTAELLNQTKRKITKLRTIAHRISDKQLENLANKSNFLKITIPMNDLCDDQRPPSPPKIPEAPETSDKLCDKPKGYTKTIMLTMNANNRKYQRIFDIKITHSYTKWNQVYVTVKATKPREDISCGEDYKENELDIHNTCAEFWVSSFDFPLVDNTYLSEDERYGIAIDGIDEKEGKITLVLVYFPASYAGLKEKSFYHKKVLNHLNNWIVIKGDKD